MTRRSRRPADSPPDPVTVAEVPDNALVDAARGRDDASPAEGAYSTEPAAPVEASVGADVAAMEVPALDASPVWMDALVDRFVDAIPEAPTVVEPTAEPLPAPATPTVLTPEPAPEPAHVPAPVAPPEPIPEPVPMHGPPEGFTLIRWQGKATGLYAGGADSRGALIMRCALGLADVPPGACSGWSTWAMASVAAMLHAQHTPMIEFDRRHAGSCVVRDADGRELPWQAVLALADPSDPLYDLFWQVFVPAVEGLWPWWRGQAEGLRAFLAPRLVRAAEIVQREREEQAVRDAEVDAAEAARAAAEAAAAAAAEAAMRADPLYRAFARMFGQDGAYGLWTLIPEADKDRLREALRTAASERSDLLQLVESAAAALACAADAVAFAPAAAVTEPTIAPTDAADGATPAPTADADTATPELTDAAVEPIPETEPPPVWLTIEYPEDPRPVGTSLVDHDGGIILLRGFDKGWQAPYLDVGLDVLPRLEGLDDDRLLFWYWFVCVPPVRFARFYPTPGMARFHMSVKAFRPSPGAEDGAVSVDFATTPPTELPLSLAQVAADVIDPASVFWKVAYPRIEALWALWQHNRGIIRALLVM
jgi:hypothetical protein